MSFNLFRKSQPVQLDIRQNYKKLAEDFCRQYYSHYDNNFLELSHVYYPDSQFTYQGQEFTGFNTLLKKLFENGIGKFTHYSMNITSQPIGPSHMLININGLVSLNDSIFTNKFIETLFVKRDDMNNLHVCSTIFKVVE